MFLPVLTPFFILLGCFLGGTSVVVLTTTAIILLMLAVAIIVAFPKIATYLPSVMTAR
ncbi:MAG: hypothetical protein AAF495_13360 [Pseudomonadota bacterium]